MTQESPDLPMVVLFADDDLDDQQMLREAFEAVGKGVILRVVDDGQELVDLLERPGEGTVVSERLMILLDLNMPRKDGREALAEIKQNKLLRNIPIVIFTTSKDSADVDYSYEHGAASYVVKPRQWDDLLGFARNVGDYWFGSNVFAVRPTRGNERIPGGV